MKTHRTVWWWGVHPLLFKLGFPRASNLPPEGQNRVARHASWTLQQQTFALPGVATLS